MLQSPLKERAREGKVLPPNKSVQAKSQTGRIHVVCCSVSTIFFYMVFWQTSTNAFHTFLNVVAFSCAHVVFCNIFVWQHCVCLTTPSQTDHAQSTYRVSADGSFLVTLASGMELSLSTEPLLLGGFAGGVSPTASRCNISLPGDHAPSLIEWRQRKEQSKTNYSTYERRLRVKKRQILIMK